MGNTTFPGVNQPETIECNVQPETLLHARILQTTKTYSPYPIVFYRS